MSLFLQAVVGTGRYLLDAARIVEVRLAAGAAQWQPESPRVDLRALFGAAGTTPGCCVLITQAGGGETAALVVDAVDRLVEIGQSEWRPLPPIGPLGRLIDAVSTTLAEGRPMLRLRGELAFAAAFGRDFAAGADRG